jgi:DNA-directed RNA polymerase subunit alpha
MENFLLPSKVEFQEGQTPNSGSVVITPCYHGYGTTLGNALRRVLLSSLPGSAVEHFKVKGVSHEFSTIEGVKEDAMEVMLNLKQLAVKVFSDEPVVLNLSKKGPGVVTAADFKANSNVEVVNPDLVIANLTGSKTFEIDVTVGKGRGYKPVEEKDKQNYDLGTIVMDSVYTPVKDVGYKVEYTRVGDITNFERLTLNIETNGTITPKDALLQSTQILINHFNIILDEVNASVSIPSARVEAEEETAAEAMPEAAEETETETDEDDEEKKPKAKKTKKKS